MLKPGNKKTHRAYLWAYAPSVHEELKAVIYDFAESRSGENARHFVGDWRGSLVCDDFSGYKAMIANGITEVGCIAHARRKFFELHVANKSQIAEHALELIRQERSRPIANVLFEWMRLQRMKITDGSVAVETEVALCPPHRSVRAELPHTALALGM